MKRSPKPPRIDLDNKDARGNGERQNKHGRGKGAVISDCRVFLGIIDEGDNNDTCTGEREKSPDFRSLTRANGSCTKFVEGSPVSAGKAKCSSAAES